MMQEPWNISVSTGIRPSKSGSCSPIRSIVRPKLDPFHVTHKVPVGDTPYMKAKWVQLVDKDPEKAIALFWAAINAGDRVDSALKDMAIVMKQQNRAEEAIEVIKSLRNQCSDQAQESLDNILLDLYKLSFFFIIHRSFLASDLLLNELNVSNSSKWEQRCGRLDDQIALLKHKLQLIQQGLAFNGKRTKTARSQGRKFQVSVEQEATRLLGNLGWALMQKDNYVEAEAAYRRALRMGPDNNKMCNLGICLMKQGRKSEAKETLKQVRPAVIDSLRGADSHLKAYDRAQEMLDDLEAKLSGHTEKVLFDQNSLFDAFVDSSSIWHPHPCIDHLIQAREHFPDENINMNRVTNASLDIDAPPFYSSRVMEDLNGINRDHLHDPMCNLKRTRSGNVMGKSSSLPPRIPVKKASEQGDGRKSVCVAATEHRWPELPDNNEFNDAIVVAAVLAPVLEDDGSDTSKTEGKMGKRLRIFQDITQASNSSKS